MRQHLFKGLKELGSDSEKDGINCLLCPAVIRNLIPFQKHTKECMDLLEEEINLVQSGNFEQSKNPEITEKLEEELLNKVEEPVKISCENCGKIFKNNFGKKRHMRESCVTKQDLNPVIPEVQEPEIESEPVIQDTEMESEPLQELNPDSSVDFMPNLDLLGFPTDVAQAQYRYSDGQNKVNNFCLVLFSLCEINSVTVNKYCY